jgi:hypothetical protein
LLQRFGAFDEWMLCDARRPLSAPIVLQGHALGPMLSGHPVAGRAMMALMIFIAFAAVTVSS